MKNFLLILTICFCLFANAQVPVNDEISGAISLCYNTSVNGSTSLATKGVDENGFCLGTTPTAPGVWYSFTGNGENIELNTCSGSNYDTRIFLYTGISGFLSCVTQNDDGCGVGTKSKISFTSVLNQDYLLLVSGYTINVGDFGLEIITTTDSLEINACENYMSPSGNLYTMSSMFYDTLLGSNGCDSLTFIDLTINSNIITSANVISNSNCSGENSDTIVASSSSALVNSHNWYDAPIGGNLLFQGNIFTPVISSSSTFYVEPDASIPAPMPSQTNTAGPPGTRGYWFTAPNSFVITSLQVPNMFSSTTQSVSVIKMDNAVVPPTAALSTNDFSILFLTQANPNIGKIGVNISINAGDVIGILGSSGTSYSSLSNINNYTIINGDTAHLTSIGFSSELITTAPQNVSDYSFSSFIDIIDFDYITTDVCLPSARTSIFVEVFENYLDSLVIQTCDSYISPIGDLYTGSSIFYDTLSSVNGCDSVVYVDLTLEYNISDSLNIIACDTFISPAGKTFTSSAIFTDTLYTSVGCYEFKHIDLTIGNSSLDSITEIACDSYITPNGTVRTQSAIFYDTLSSNLGCDSVVFVDLTVNFSFLGAFNIEVCDSFISAQGNVYDTSTVFYDTLMTSLGCDSVLYTTLTVHESTLETLIIDVCDSYISPSGMAYTNSGLFYDTLTTINGCDSIFFIDLEVNNSQITNLNVTECNTYISPLGNTYTSSSMISDTLSTVFGCDSIININLTINYSTLDSIYPEECGSYTSPLGNVYTSTSLFNEIFTTSNGCDSVVTIFLTIHSEDTIYISPFSCGPYTSPAGNLYTSSANFTEVLTSSLGCDSIYNVDLIIPTVSASNISPVVCNTYISPLGFTFTNSQVFTENLTASNGCDSIVTINLTVNKTKYDTLEISTCGEFISPNGMQYLTSGVYSENFIAASGCDSIFVIDLILNPINKTVDKLHDVLSSLEFGATYQWYNCETNQEIQGETGRQYIAPENGSYQVIIENGSCIDTSVCVNVNSITSINDLSIHKIKVYPNPTKGRFTIAIDNNNESVAFEIYNILGKKVKEGNISNNVEHLSLENLDNGVYFINLSNQVYRIVKK